LHPRKKRGKASTLSPADPNAAPDHLQPATRIWFESVIADFALDQHHVRMLVLAAEAWDLSQQAREQLASAGITFMDQNGNPRAHPAVAIERDARLAFVRIIRELDLEGETLPAPRPTARGRR
jgi:phage terminase small subunit